MKHERCEKTTTTWITPKYIIDACGPFDLDPCCPALMPHKTAHTMIQRPQDGLSVPWAGRVWLNPPYANIEPWMDRMSEHGNGVALVTPRTGSKWFQRTVFRRAKYVLFLDRRIRFIRDDFTESKSPTTDSCLVFYCNDDLVNFIYVNMLQKELGGYLVTLYN